MALVATGPATPAVWARAVLEAASVAFPLGLAAWLTGVICRTAAAEVAARSERDVRRQKVLIDLADRAIDALERAAEAIEQRPIADVPSDPPDRERVRALAEVDEALRTPATTRPASSSTAWRPDTPAILP